MDDSEPTSRERSSRDSLRSWVWDQELSIKQKLVFVAAVEFGKPSLGGIEVSVAVMRRVSEATGLQFRKVEAILKGFRVHGGADVYEGKNDALTVIPRRDPLPYYEHLALLGDCPGYVYLMRCGPYYKIGRSVDVEKRARSLQTGSAQEIEILAARWVRDSRGYERVLHERYASQRGGGEWFTLQRPEVRAIVTVLGEWTGPTELTREA